MPKGKPQQMHWRFGALILLLLALVILTIAWSWGPLKSWLDLNLLIEKFRALRDAGQEVGFLDAAGAIALASLLAIPLSIIIPLAALGLEPWHAFGALICGATLGGSGSFMLGSYLGRESVQKMAGERISTISQGLAKRGVLSVFIIRLLPIAPFAIVNMVAGTSHIRLRDFILGTMLGMTPGVALAVLFIDYWIAKL